MDGSKSLKRLSIIRDEGEENDEPLHGEGPLFQQYLEKEGIIDFLTNELIQLYKANRPENGLDVLRHNISAQLLNEKKLKTPKQAQEDPFFQDAINIENESLKYRVQSLEKENENLSLKVEQLTNSKFHC